MDRARRCIHRHDVRDRRIVLHIVRRAEDITAISSEHSAPLTDLGPYISRRAVW
jgi:hypothetical protein